MYFLNRHSMSASLHDFVFQKKVFMCHIDWCCFYYFLRNSLVALLEALFAPQVHKCTYTHTPTDTHVHTHSLTHAHTYVRARISSCMSTNSYKLGRCARGPKWNGTLWIPSSMRPSCFRCLSVTVGCIVGFVACCCGISQAFLLQACVRCSVCCWVCCRACCSVCCGAL